MNKLISTIINYNILLLNLVSRLQNKTRYQKRKKINFGWWEKKGKGQKKEESRYPKFATLSRSKNGPNIEKVGRSKNIQEPCDTTLKL